MIYERKSEIDGSWSEWSLWSTCNVSCGVGYKTRNRSCDNPAPLYGGANCTGTLEDEKTCDFLPPCAVDGGWSPWTSWSNCTETCRNGTRTRRRSCDRPLPQHGGANCTGDVNQTQACGQDQACYVPSVTSDAKPDLVDNGTITESTIAVTFSDQMFSLGLSMITHFTVIVAEDVTGLNDSMETGLVRNAQTYSWYDVQGLSPVPPYQVSSLAPYPFTSSLRQKRSTESQDISFTIGGENCTDPNVTLYCNGPLKPATTYRAKMRVFTPNGYFADSYYSAAMSTLAYSWSDWTQWSVCTVSCGAGNQTRHRTCTTAPGNNGTGSVATCTGDSLQTRACLNIGPCPVDGVWSPWSVWSTCITTCGLGNQTRNRTCSQPLHGGTNCTGNRVEVQTCTGPLKPHCTSTAGPTVAQTTPSPDPLAPSDGGTMEEFTRWETGEALPETYDAQESPVDMSKGEPLPTSSGVKLESIGWLSEKTMDFNITATFTVAWTDERLATLGGSGWIPVPSHVLWLPSVQFGRTVKARWSVTTSSEMTSVGKEDNGPESGTVSTWLSPEGQISHKLKWRGCVPSVRD
ncbi:coadhesin-like [Branchiostoma lanceolatum]|uniref:coadhesin-like n=1 Tax=Branchiostoma lanceolatum TaxID=7740 RepID=UPI003453177F